MTSYSTFTLHTITYLPLHLRHCKSCTVALAIKKQHTLVDISSSLRPKYAHKNSVCLYLQMATKLYSILLGSILSLVISVMKSWTAFEEA